MSISPQLVCITSVAGLLAGSSAVGLGRCCAPLFVGFAGLHPPAEPPADVVPVVLAGFFAWVAVAVEEFVRKLWGLGLRASVEEVVTVGAALQFVLATTPTWKRAFVIGSDAIHRHVAAAGVRETMNGADVVVIAGHDRFDYDELRYGAQAILNGAQAICTSRDATFPMADGPWPGTGAIVAAVE